METLLAWWKWADPGRDTFVRIRNVVYDVDRDETLSHPHVIAEPGRHQTHVPFVKSHVLQRQRDETPSTGVVQRHDNALHRVPVDIV